MLARSSNGEPAMHPRRCTPGSPPRRNSKCSQFSPNFFAKLHQLLCQLIRANSRCVNTYRKLAHGQREQFAAIPDSASKHGCEMDVCRACGVQLSAAVAQRQKDTDSQEPAFTGCYVGDSRGLCVASSRGIVRLGVSASTATIRPQRSGEAHMAGKFEITKDKAGKFRFRLKAGNGEIIAVSEAYETKASAKNGIESVKTNAPGATVVDLSE